MAVLRILLEFFGALQEFFRVAPRSIGERATQHLPDFNRPLLVGQRAYLGHRAISMHLFGNIKVFVSQGSNLRQMRDTDNLMVGGQIPEFFADDLAAAPADAAVDFVEDEGRGGIGG